MAHLPSRCPIEGRASAVPTPVRNDQSAVSTQSYAAVPGTMAIGCSVHLGHINLQSASWDTLATTPVGKKQRFDVWCLWPCIASLKRKFIQSGRENKRGWLQARGGQQTMPIAGYQGKNSNADGPRSRSRSRWRKIMSKWRGKE